MLTHAAGPATFESNNKNQEINVRYILWPGCLGSTSKAAHDSFSSCYDGTTTISNELWNEFSLQQIQNNQVYL